MFPTLAVSAFKYYEGLSLYEFENNDVLYDEAKQFVIQTQKASTSLIQRKFSIGYQRAARLIDMMEDNGIVGPSRGSKPREVYIKNNINGELE